MDMLPADISRDIYKMAIKAKDEDNRKQIHATIWCVLDFINTSRVLYNEVPLFEGSLKHLYVTAFNVDKIQQCNGLIETRMVFVIGDDEFEVTYNDYADYAGDADVCMYVANKHGLYKDIAADAFWACFPNGTVY
jgi:hypothetical protein